MQESESVRGEASHCTFLTAHCAPHLQLLLTRNEELRKARSFKNAPSF